MDKIPEGFIDPSALAPPEGFIEPKVGIGEDLAKSARAGLAGGVAAIPGAFGDIRKFGEYIGGLAGSTPEQIRQARAETSKLPFGWGGKSPISALLDKAPSGEDVAGATGLDRFDYDPRSMGGRFAKAIAGGVPGAVLGGGLTGGVPAAVLGGRLAGGAPGAVLGGGLAQTPGLLAANVARYAVAPGAASQAVGEIPAVQKSEYGPLIQMGAGLLGSGAASKLITPNPFSGGPQSRAQYAKDVKTVRDQGIYVSPADEVGSKGMRTDESVADPEAWRKRAESVTKAATKVIGDPVEAIDHAVGGFVDRNQARLGAPYDALTAKYNMPMDAELATDLLKTRNKWNAKPGLYDANEVKAVNAAIDDLGSVSSRSPGLNIPGPEFKQMVSDFRDVVRSAEPGSAKARGVADVVKAMNAAMERGIGAVNKADAGKFKQADIDWKNFLVLKDAITHSGTTMYLSPAAIERAAKGIYGETVHERGKDPFHWAPAAKNVLGTIADSGTAGRLRSHEVAHWLSGAIGSGTGGLIGSALGHGGITGADSTLGGLWLGKELAPVMEPGIARVLDKALFQRGNQILGGRPPGMLSLPSLLRPGNQQQQDIPRFAQGGVITQPTVGMVGENGPEAIVPLGGQQGIYTANAQPQQQPQSQLQALQPPFHPQLPPQLQAAQSQFHFQLPPQLQAAQAQFSQGGGKGGLGQPQQPQLGLMQRHPTPTQSPTPTVQAFAEGGVVDRPTVGLLGENGPEAVVPLRQMGAPYQPDVVGNRPDVQAGVKSAIEGAAEPFGLLGRVMTGRSETPLQDLATAAIGMVGPPGAGSVKGLAPLLKASPKDQLNHFFSNTEAPTAASAVDWFKTHFENEGGVAKTNAAGHAVLKSPGQLQGIIKELEQILGSKLTGVEKQTLFGSKQTASKESRTIHDEKTVEKALAEMHPIEWQGQGPSIFTQSTGHASPEMLSRQGYNPNLPLFKGYSSPQYKNVDKFGHPAYSTSGRMKAEPAMFFADNPHVAEEYAHHGTGTFFAAPKNPMAVDWRAISPRETYSPAHMEDLLTAAQRRNIDLLKIRNIEDLGGIQNQYAMLDRPGMLRKPEARFDPSRLGESGLLLGLLGGGAMIGGRRRRELEERQ